MPANGKTRQHNPWLRESTALLIVGLALLSVPATGYAAETESEQVSEVAGLIAHFGGILDRLGQPGLTNDPQRYRETADRLEKDGLTAEIRRAASHCVKLHQLYEARLAKWIEMTREYPDPAKRPGDILSDVLRKSSAGAYSMEVDFVIEHRMRNGLAWQETRREVQDKSWALAPMEFGLQWMVAQQISREHAKAVAKLKQAAARDLVRLDAQMEEQRQTAADQLLKLGPRQNAGPPVAGPLLEPKLGEVFEPLDVAWRKRRQRELDDPPPADPKARAEWESQQRFRVGGSSIGFQNQGPTLTQVVLEVEYTHCLHPQEPVVRQVYWIPEWRHDEVFSVLDGFRPNLPAGKKPALQEQLLEVVGELGEPLFPGFSGLVGIRYSLWSAEHRQEGVELPLPRQRAAISHARLNFSESLATLALREDGVDGPGDGKATAALDKKRLVRARQLAREALALAGPDWPLRDRAKQLADDPKSAIGDQSTGPWAGTQAGTIFELSTSSVIGLGVPAGEYRLEFSGLEKKSKAILGKLVINSFVDQQRTSYPFRGEIMQNPDTKSHQLQLVLELPDDEPAVKSGKSQPAGKPNAATKKPKKSSKKSKEDPPPADNPIAQQPAIRQDRLPREWVLDWENDTWMCRRLTVPFERKPKDGKTAAPLAEDPELPIGSTWLGIRQLIHRDGRVLMEERFTIRLERASIQRPGQTLDDLMCDIHWDGGYDSNDGSVRRLKSAGLGATTVEFKDGYVLGGGQPGKPGIAGRHPPRGELREGVIEGLQEQPRGDPDEAEYTVIRRQ